jgi:hypothetical protein
MCLLWSTNWVFILWKTAVMKDHIARSARLGCVSSELTNIIYSMHWVEFMSRISQQQDQIECRSFWLSPQPEATALIRVLPNNYTPFNSFAAFAWTPLWRSDYLEKRGVTNSERANAVVSTQTLATSIRRWNEAIDFSSYPCYIRDKKD